MEVYLVPVGGERYELYFEASHGLSAATGSTRGYFGRWRDYFHTVLDGIERERHHPPAEPDPGASWRARLFARMRRGAMRWLAEKVAEQRVLWQLRGASEAVGVFPADLDEPAAVAVVRRMLQHDAARHGRWLIVHAVLFVGSGILALIPGPNIVAYYFAFRLVGHYLSRQGASDGLKLVRWHMRPSVELADLRRAIPLAPVERDRQVHDIASRLRLQHLAAFFERTVLRTT